MQEETLEGLAFIGDTFTPRNVRIIIENGRISEITDSETAFSQWIVPVFFNAHTHIADTIGMDTRIDRPLSELVAPPNGLKHRLLRETSDDRLVSAMRDTISFMKATGTLGFADFREGGRRVSTFSSRPPILPSGWSSLEETAESLPPRVLVYPMRKARLKRRRR